MECSRNLHEEILLATHSMIIKEREREGSKGEASGPAKGARSLGTEFTIAGCLFNEKKRGQ
jgi:hypothetical protein